MAWKPSILKEVGHNKPDAEQVKENGTNARKFNNFNEYCCKFISLEQIPVDLSQFVPIVSSVQCNL